MKGRSVSVALGIATQNARKLLRNPAKALPPMLFPLFFFAAFTGALSAVGDTSGFGYYNFTAFEFVLVLYMAAMFVGVFTAFDVALDYERGMGNRLMAAAPRRMAIVAGYSIVSLARAVVSITVVWIVALLAGMPVRGQAADIVALVALALLLNVATTLYGVGLALRFRSTAAGVLILIPVFMVLFLTPVFAPRHQLAGWLETAAGLNPLTPPMEAGRGFLANNPVSVGLAFAAAAGLVLLFAVWAVRGMRKAERGPGGRRRWRPQFAPGTQTGS
jgi:ABC-2 type transport system permease protein